MNDFTPLDASHSAKATTATSSAPISPVSPIVAAASSSRHASASASTPASAVILGALPAANGLPSDPVEASAISSLFAHPPASATNSGAESPFPISPPVTPAPTSAKAVSPGLSALSTSPAQRSAAFPIPISNTSPNDRQLSGSRPLSAANAGGLALSVSPILSSEPHTPNAQSIFERDIEHRDASHVMTKQEAMDVAIPSVLDDAVEALVEDDAEIEVVAPQNTAPPLALSSAALSVHSGANSPFLTSSPSPPLSTSGVLDAPPGTIAAQIAERMGSPRGPSSEVPRGLSTPNAARPRRSSGHLPRLGSEVDSATSYRSRSSQPVRVHDLLDPSPVQSRASGSPKAAHSSPHGLMAGGMPTATAFPSLPLPNPYRSSSPNLSAMALPSFSAGADAGRPAESSLSIDGAVINGTEVATLDHSLGSISDVLAAHDAEQAASPYVPRSPMTSSPSLAGDKTRIRHMPSNSNLLTPPTALGLPQSGLGVFGTSENLFQALASGSPSPSSEKRRLSFFSYADILNENKGEVMDLRGMVRQAAERDEQQHSHMHVTPSHYASEHGTQQSIMQQLGQGSAGMARSVSTGAAAPSPRLGAPLTKSVGGTGTNTPTRGRREHLENVALSNRLDSLQLATDLTPRKA